jgi:tRNA/tmRNA/rRNA uracil-C5-methylase (TrmA/RlmC/RlmD family)
MPSGHRELTIESVVAGGDGLARDEGRVVFVAGALPGERVRAAVVEEHTGYAKAALIEVLDAAPARIAPPCPHVAEGCGGCGWQHVDPAAQPTLKASIVADALRRVGHVAVPTVTPGPVLPPFGYRTTLRGAVLGGRIGLRHHRGHDVVVLEHCLVAHPRLDELVSSGRFGTAREVTLRVGAATGERLAIIDPDVGPGVELPEDVRVVGRRALRRGRRVWIHDEVAGRRWRISADAFFQTRTDGAGALVDAVRTAIGGAAEHRVPVVDLYAGVGLLGGAATGADSPLTAVESGASAAADARTNLVDRDATVLKMDVARWRPAPAGVVIADPSRAGVGRAVVERIAATGAARVVLVGCDAATFARDAGLLTAAGYGLGAVTLVDLFPHTPHVEVVGRFDRSSNHRAGAEQQPVRP